MSSGDHPRPSPFAQRSSLGSYLLFVQEGRAGIGTAKTSAVAYLERQYPVSPNSGTYFGGNDIIESSPHVEHRIDAPVMTGRSS